SAYEALNAQIQKSIIRARSIRSELLVEEPIPEVNPIQFARSVNELKRRIHYDFGQFAESLGRKPSKSLFNQYDSQKRLEENTYLFLDDEGEPLSKEQTQNLMTLHILKALTSSLDSHSSFFDPKEAFDLKIKLQKGFEGIGVHVEKRGSYFYVTEILKGSPAEKSKQIKEGDQLIRIDNQKVDIKPLVSVVEMLRSEGKKQIVLTLVRNGRTFKVTLNKAFIPIDEGRVKEQAIPWNNGIIGFITIDSFYRGKNEVSTENDLKKAIERLKLKGSLKGLILDMRDNSGGFLSEAVNVAGLFMTTGIVVVSKYENGSKKLYRDLDHFDAYNGPIIVLTSKATASAAEIVAQALQDYGIALIVGDQRTYGKGTIQSQTTTSSDATSQFKVTVGQYYTVSGKSPQKTGVLADILVPGIYHNEMIGEEYLEDPIESGKIAALFEDPLQDVERQKRPWFLSYYVPSLQKKTTEWKMMVPYLRRQSEKRLAQNVDYQQLIYKPVLNQNEAAFINKVQVDEAILIIKDMNRHN
ncbi:MAG: S41 family peptidase, partial [Waddliaceae bacterium]